MAEAQCSQRVNTARDLRQFGLLLVWSESQKGKAIFLGSRGLILLVFRRRKNQVSHFR